MQLLLQETMNLIMKFYTLTFLLHQILEKSVNSSCNLFINASTVLKKFTNAYSLTKYQFNDWLVTTLLKKLKS